MSFLELQNQVIQLPVAERVVLMEQIRDSLSEAEIEAFWVEKAEQVVDLVDAGQMPVFTKDYLRKRRAEQAIT